MGFRWTTALLATALSVAVIGTGVGSPSAEASGRAGLSEKDLRGTWTAFFQGELTEGPVTGHATAVGLIRFDGMGRYEVDRIVTVAGPGGTVVLEQTADCTYEVNPQGGAATECTVSTPGLPDAHETLAGTITSRSHMYFMSTTPGLSAVGEARRQSRTGR